MKKTIQMTMLFFLLPFSSVMTYADEFIQSESVATVNQKNIRFTQIISSLASGSSCATYSWKNRGRAPAGYIKGVALSFARSLCRVRANGSIPAAAPILSSVSSQNQHQDALAHYQSVFSKLGINTSVPGESPVNAIYALGMGLGMRESSGTYCEGWDVGAGSQRTSAEAEAGAFQVSYDSMAMSVELKKLYQEYRATPERCLLEVFKENVSCKARSILGTGAGAVYQSFNKACPAFATEYAMTLLRLQRTHFGPINRHEAEVAPVCLSMLTAVQNIVDKDPEAACGELF